MKHYIFILLAVSFSFTAQSQPDDKPANQEIIYSAIGIPLSYETIYKSHKQGHCVYRNEDGVIIKWGYYDEGESFWGMEFLFNKDLTRKLADVKIIQRDLSIEVHPNMQQNAIDTLLKLCKKYNDFSDHPGLSQMRKDLTPDLNDYAALKIESEKFERGNFLIYYLVSLAEDYLALKIQEPLIDYYFSQFSARNFSPSKPNQDKFVAPLDLSHRKTHEFRDSLENLYYKTFDLSNKLKNILTHITASRQTDSLLILNLSFISEKYFVHEFDKLHRERLEPLVRRAQAFLRHDSLVDILAEQSLIDEFKPYHDKYPELKAIDDSIKSITRKLNDLVSKGQNSNTISYTTALNLEVKPYYEETRLNEKLAIGKLTIKSLLLKLAELQSLTDIDNLIDLYLPGIKKRYLAEQPVIFKSEILPLEEQITAYKSEESVVIKLESGKHLLSLLHYLDEQFDTLMKYEVLIDKKYKSLKTDYQNQYPEIYLNDIKPIEVEINTCENESFTELKIARAHNLFAKFNALNQDLLVLNSQQKEIIVNLSKAGSLYKKKFPKVYKTEYSQLEKKCNEYKKCASLASRQESGNLICTSIQRMIKAYDTISFLDSLIRINYKPLNKKFLKNFPGIHKVQYGIIKPQYDSYISSGQSREKYDQSIFIWQKLMFLSNQYDFLDSLEIQLDNSLKVCEEFYKNNNENQLIWKKGMKAYNYFHDNFHKEEDPGKAEDQVNNLIILINKLITIAKKDNGYLKETLKKSKSPEEIRIAFGI